MSKKKMSIHYVPAQLKDSVPTNWYIEWYQYHPVKKKLERKRKTFKLNSKKMLPLRRARAYEIIEDLNAKLRYGWPYEQLVEDTKVVTIEKGIQMALDMKMRTDSVASRNSYSSVISIFQTYLREHHMMDLPMYSFTKAHALKYLDYCLIKRKIKNTTHNNYRMKIGALFTWLVSRQYIQSNPFAGIKKRKPEAKRRRAFSEEERKVFVDYMKVQNKWVYLGILLQYYCFIRPVEMSKLRRRMFDFKLCVINLPGTITKNSERSIVTIPNVIVDTIKELVEEVPSSWYVFGAALNPHATLRVSKNLMNGKHKKALEHLKSTGRLNDIEGLSFYSWKDTGAYELFRRHVNILEIMRQMRHKELNTTQRYCISLYMVNQEIKELDNRI